MDHKPQDDREQVKLRLPRDLKLWLQKLAAKHSRTLNAEVVHRLTASVAQEAAQ